MVVKNVLAVLVQSIVSLIVLFAVCRLGGKRQIAQMSMFDYINSISIGSIAAELATNLEEWYKPLTAILVYGLAAWLVHLAACHSIEVRTIISGRAEILMENGILYKKRLAAACIDLDEFFAQSRIAGFYDPNEIACATLETNGQISFLPKSVNRPASPEDLQLHPAPVSSWTVLILDGNLQATNLHQSGKDVIWLKKQLAQYGIGKLGEAFYAACDKQDNFFACPINS